MPIEVHCEKCGTLVRAPDNAGGKKGKCPTCEADVYIPTPSDQLEPLDIEPLDESAEAQRKQLIRETHELEVAALRDDKPDRSGGGKRPAPTTTSQPAARMSVDETRAAVRKYAVAMATGDLATADALAAKLKASRQHLDGAVSELLNDPMPPDAIANLPRPVLIGFFKQLNA